MKIWVTVLLLLMAGSVLSQSDIKLRKEYNLENGLALKGYDPVAYFAQHKAVKGKKEYAFSFHGISYHFESAADRQLFQTDPSKYEPQYGGWCAYAMGHDGSRVEVDPETFKIINGKLFLFYNRFFNNTLKVWNQDESKLHTQADANWQKFLEKNLKSNI